MSVHVDMINLHRDTARRALAAETLEGVGLSVSFVPAVDFVETGLEDLLRECKPEGPWGVFKAQDMAGTLSHARAWERFLATDATHCLILEDDVFIARDIALWLDDLQWWPPGADIVKLERWRSQQNMTLAVLEKPAVTHRHRAVSRLLSRHVGAAGYILTRSAAEHLLNVRPFDITIDNLLFNFNASRIARRMKIYQMNPAMVQQGNEPPQDGARRPQTRHRPKGWPRIRQHLRRAYHEIAYPLPTIWKVLTGRARLTKITYQAEVCEPMPSSHLSSQGA